MMERILLGVLYLSGCHIFSSCLVHQYHYVADRMNWTEAQTYCRKTYTDLASIENSEEMNQLVSTVSSAGNKSEVWIGLHTKINWRWSDGYRGSGAEYRNWKTNEPNEYIGNHVGVVVQPNGLWNDGANNAKQPFICNNGTQLDPEFVLVNERMSWSSAQRYCREHFTDLATVRTDTENKEIQNLGTEHWPWIGLFRDPQIYWSDRSGSSFTYWATGAHPIGLMSVMCGVSVLRNSGKWTLSSCENKFPFVCYTVRPPPAVMRRVIKLRIKDPSVDLNDPAVKAGILKKLQDRLKEKGVSGVTLKWKEQPDGKVFHKEGKSSEKKKRRKTEL